MPANTSIITKKDNRDARLMLVRQMLSVPIRFLRSIVVLPLLSPDYIFILKLISTWLGYAVRGNLGTFNLLGFYFPAAQAKKDTSLGKKYKYQAWLFNLFATCIGGAIGAVIAIFYLNPWHVPTLILWGIGTVSMSYMINYYQAVGNFNKIAIVDILNLVVGFFVALGGLLLFGFNGYLIGCVLPMVIVLIIGRDTYFPEKTPISFGFLKQSLQEGWYLTVGGFLSSFVKAHEITFFAFLTMVNKTFAGQYAVAITLTAIQDNFITSISKVYQRKVTMELTTSEQNDKYKIIYNFALLDVILFSMTSSVFLLGGLLFPYLFPAYKEVVWILPFLLMGVAIQRGRYYPGLVFKLAKEFKVNILAHAIHLIACVSVFFTLLYVQQETSYMLAVNQIVGAAAGTVFLWGWYFHTKDKSAYGVFILRFSIMILLLLVYFGIFIFLLENPLQCIATVIISNIIIIAYSFFFLKDAFKLLIDIFWLKFKRS